MAIPDVNGPQAVLILALLLTVLAGCGTPASRHSVLTTSSTAASPTPPALTTNAAGRIDLPTQPLSPYTYSADHPCASVQTETSLLQSPAGCEALWDGLGTPTIPGQDLLTDKIWPRNVRVYGDLPSALGREWATAYLRDQAFSTWAIRNHQLAVARAVDPPASAGDTLKTALEQGANVTMPACAYPTGLTAVQLDQQSLDAVHAAGWPNPSASAIVAFFPPCSGTVLSYPNGSVRRIGVTTSPLAIVVTGQIASNTVFGKIWSIDGEADCGPAALVAVCGLAG